MQLLISVTSASEARAAMAGGADILDVKNPAEGSLGAPVPQTVLEIRAAAPRPHRLSVAIGDMPNLPGTAALAALGAAACGADYVKVGLWGSRTEAEATALLRAVREAIAAYPGLVLIAGGYADAARTGTLDPAALPRVAAAAGAGGMLIDTAIKDGHSLFDYLTPEALRLLAREAHSAGLLFAVAGALQEEHLSIIRPLGVDVVGLRSAVCAGGLRSGPLDVERVRRLCAVAAGRQS